MPQVRHVLDAIERIAPKRFAFAFDKVGLQLGDPDADVQSAVVSLDRSLGAVAFAAKSRAQMLVAHHPLIFEPLQTVLQTSHVGRTVLELAKNNIAFAAAHTNWDSAKGGVNDTLARLLGLVDVADFGSAAAVERLKAVVFCPPDAVDKVIDAAAEAGAGVIGEYLRCAFLAPGTGTYYGGPNANPSVGHAGQVEHVDEVRVEMVLPESQAHEVDRAIRSVHPYEEPAVDFFRLATAGERAAGRVGALPKPLSLREVAAFANERLGAASWVWGDPDRMIGRLAVVGGAADGEWRAARQSGADALVTGEVKQHVGLEAAEEGFAIIASGHYQTEHPGCATLRDRLAEAMPEVDWLLYTPEPGFSGRPF